MKGDVGWVDYLADFLEDFDGRRMGLIVQLDGFV